MDFGTTNSGAAVYDGRQVRLLPLDPEAPNPNVARTALYVTNDQKIAIGRQAINRYFDDNAGRPVKMKKVWVGEVEIYGADMFYIADVYAWVDVLSPGRLFLSIKSGLRDPEYQGTVVGQFYYSLENLIAIYMSLARMRAERLLGREVRQVVLGRPVRFSTDPEADALAQRRLLESAFRAGFEKVYLQQEPVAAAYHYAAGVSEPQNVLVFDFGGGTLDITIMRLDGRDGRQVLATGGLPIAGDVFDRRLVRARLPRHFGEGSTYGPDNRRLPLPKWIYDIFSDWQRIFELQTPENRLLLRDIAKTSSDRPGLEALISLVANNYALQMFDVVELAKRKLSADMATIIRLKGPGFNVTEMVTRSDFEKIIRAEILAIERHLDETVAAAGLKPDQIDAVVRTGGSSDIPAFRYMLKEKFGAMKVRSSDTFSSVTSGLGIIAHGIEQGQIEARAYTQSDRAAARQVTAGQETPRPNVSAVNLSLLQRRLVTQEGSGEEIAGASRYCLVILSAGNRLRIAPLPKSNSPASEQQQHQIGQRPLAILDTALDEPLLMITSRFRFVLTTAGHLRDLAEVGLEVAGYFQLKPQEEIRAMTRWSEARPQPSLLVATTVGYARAYQLNKMIESIEGPTPYQFNRKLPGVPAAIFGATPEDHLVLLLDSGRGVRYQVGQMPVQGLQAINRRDGEQLAGVDLVREDETLLLLTASGYGRRMEVRMVPVPPKANTRGRVLVARRPVCGLAQLDSGRQVWAITNRRWLALDPQQLPAAKEDSTRSWRLLKLSKGETIEAAVSLRPAASS
jgi:hypothetical chaperone protein